MTTASEPLPTVRSEYGLCCPKCGRDREITISIQAWIYVEPDGTHEAPWNEHTWDDASDCVCRACTHRGTVADFTVADGP